MAGTLLEDPAYAEVEAGMSVVTHRSRDQNRSEDGVDEETSGHVHGEIRRADSGGQFVCFSYFQHSESVDRTAQEGREFGEHSDVAELTEEVLVCE